MIRITAVSFFVFCLSIYAWKDWYKSLCGLILLMSVMEHPDMPKTIMGIQGFNLWNACFAVIFLAWFSSRRREGLSWDMPRNVNILLLLYLIIIIGAFLRIFSPPHRLSFLDVTSQPVPITMGKLVSEYLINTIKWVLPGILLYDGCRTRSRFLWGLGALLSIYLLLALQVIKWMPFEYAASGADLSRRSLKILTNEIGYHRVNLSMMLAGASWAVFATRPLSKNPIASFLIIVMSFIVVFGQALTGGRAGYATWGMVGAVLCVLRWRKYLILAPLAVLLIVAILPGTVDRFTQGFDEQGLDTNPRVQKIIGQHTDGPDWYTITAGRNVAWLFVIPAIRENPIFGYGREAMQRTGIAGYLWDELGESFPHPHNAFLEMLLDNGLIGLSIVLAFYLTVFRYGYSLFRDRCDPICVTIGGVTLALVLALFFAGIGSQSFYPREGSVGMWCAIFLMFRVYVERSHMRGTAGPGGSPETSAVVLARA